MSHMSTLMHIYWGFCGTCLRIFFFFFSWSMFSVNKGKSVQRVSDGASLELPCDIGWEQVVVEKAEAAWGLEWGVVGAWCCNLYLSLKQPFFLTLMLFLNAWVGITRPPTMLVPPFASQAEGKRKRRKTQLRWILCSCWDICYFLYLFS